MGLQSENKSPHFSKRGDKKISEKLPLRAAVLVAMVAAFFLFSFRAAIGDALWRRFHFARSAVFFNRDADFAMKIGNYYFGGGAYDLDAAERAYRGAVAVNPKILWGHYQLARILFLKKDFAGALAEINGEFAANPENLRSLYVRGLIYGYRGFPGDLEKAEADFRRFTLWAPKEWAGYNDLAWILSKESKYEDAQNAILAALREVNNADRNPWLWNALGVAELNLNKYSEAAEAFSKAKSLAANLSLADWRRAYPGNNPDGAAEGMRAFRDAIEKNLLRAQR